jgi:oxygen-dependent protoporphyrinogen oxidase
MSRLVIVGGGMAGLAAAYRAHRADPSLEIGLLEAAERLGGKVHTVAEEGFVLEGGPDAVVRYKPWALALMEELGLEGQVVGTLPARPSALIHDGERALPIPAGLQMVVPGDLKALALTPLLSPFGKARALLELLLPKGPPDDEPFGAFIQRRLGRQAWERLAAPLSGGIYGGDPYALSTLAAFPQLKALEQEHGSLLRGALRQRGQRGSREAGQLFASLAGGLGQWVRALEQSLSVHGPSPSQPGIVHSVHGPSPSRQGIVRGGVTVRLGTAASALERRGEGWRIHTPQGWLEADAVILTTPASVSAQLLEPVHPSAAEALRQIPYGDSATVSLAFPLEGLPPRIGHGMLMAAGQGFAARGFTWSDQKWKGRAPEGYGLVRAYFSGVRADEGELLRLALADLRRLWGKVPPPERSWVFRWAEGLPHYTLGHQRRVAAAMEAESLPGLFLAGAAYFGVGLPEVVRMGQEKALKAVEFLRS